MCTVCLVYIPIRYEYATNTSLIRYFVDSFFERLVFGPFGGGYSFCAVVRIFPLRILMYTNIIKHLFIVKTFSDTLKLNHTVMVCIERSVLLQFHCGLGTCEKENFNVQHICVL